ncbi:hypothetical protein [Acetobacter fabarum]|uniref:hypothetical protein n=1 Tax=Acetobacter fabarum TaxID=483199 RepID=UPI0039E914B8
MTTDNQTTGRKHMVQVYEKEIPLTPDLLDVIEQEFVTADGAEVEMEKEHRGSFILIRIEADNDDAAMIHRLSSSDFKRKDLSDE